MDERIDWLKHCKRKAGKDRCGSYTIKIILSACGIKRPEFLIALYTHKWWWGTPPQLFVAYLSRFFKNVNYKTSASIKDISNHLKAGHIVVVNWWDKDDGHYTIVSKCSGGVMEMVDTSPHRNWLWEISTREFKKIWYDTLDTNHTIYHEGFMIWVDPKTKKEKYNAYLRPFTHNKSIDEQGFQADIYRA